MQGALPCGLALILGLLITVPGRARADRPWPPKPGPSELTELQFVLTALLESKPLTGPQRKLACAHPIWLDGALHAADRRELLGATCPDLHRLLRHTLGAKIDLVFVGHSFVDAASAFGHLLLRIEPPRGRETSPIALGVSFLGNSDTMNGVTRLWRGLTGSMEGRFHVEPFHLLRRQYAQFEARDLFAYRLNLSPAQQRRLALILYAARETRLPYDFFHSNCAFRLAQLLAAVNEDLSLEALGWAVGPVDVLHLLASQGAIESQPTFRASPWRLLDHRLASLSKAQLKHYKRLLDLAQPLDAPSVADDQVISAALVHLELNAPFTLFESGPSSPVGQRYKTLMMARSKGPAQTETGVPMPPGSDPLSGHPRRRLSVLLAAGHRTAGLQFDALELDFRPGMHSLLDRPDGHAPRGAVDLFATAVTLQRESGQIVLNRFHVVELHSLGMRPSGLGVVWGLSLGYGDSPWLALPRGDVLGGTGRLGFGWNRAAHHGQVHVFGAGIGRFGLKSAHLKHKLMGESGGSDPASSSSLGFEVGLRLIYRSSLRGLVRCVQARDLAKLSPDSRCEATVHWSLHPRWDVAYGWSREATTDGLDRRSKLGLQVTF